MPIMLPKASASGTGESACPTNAVSERKTNAELQGAAGERRAGDLSHRRTSDAGVRNAETGVVESVGRIEAELNPDALFHRYDLGGRKIDIRIHGAAQDVPPRIAERVLAGRYESGRVEPQSGRFLSRIERHAGHHVRVLRVGLRIGVIAVHLDGENVSRLPEEEGGDLPATQEEV